MLEKVEEIKKAIKLLAVQGYVIIDLEDNIINKWNINDKNKHNIAYNRVPKIKL